MQFKTVYGSQEERPLEAEYCGEMVFVRKNIERVTVEQEGGSVELWRYEEAYCTRGDFADYVARATAETVDEHGAKIDYIAMMSDIEFE